MAVANNPAQSSNTCWPTPPRSIREWVGNRAIAVLKTGISACTFVISGLSALLPFGEQGERLARSACALGAFFQGIRQFIYTGASEVRSSLGQRAAVCLNIANIPSPPCCDHRDNRDLFNNYFIAKAIFSNIITTGNTSRELRVENQSDADSSLESSDGSSSSECSSLIIDRRRPGIKYSFDHL